MSDAVVFRTPRPLALPRESIASLLEPTESSPVERESALGGRGASRGGLDPDGIEPGVVFLLARVARGLPTADRRSA